MNSTSLMSGQAVEDSNTVMEYGGWELHRKFGMQPDRDRRIYEAANYSRQIHARPFRSQIYGSRLN